MEYSVVRALRSTPRSRFPRTESPAAPLGGFEPPTVVGRTPPARGTRLRQLGLTRRLHAVESGDQALRGDRAKRVLDDGRDLAPLDAVIVIGVEVDAQPTCKHA